MNRIIESALTKYKPVKVLLLFSGGHDSLCSTHHSAQVLARLGIPFTVYHGNTGIGIRQTREFVRAACDLFGWELYEGHPLPGQTYEDNIRKYGFPGPSCHKYLYRILKERALRHYISHCCKSSPHARENVLLLTGIRQSESKIRMGYKDHTKKESSRVWCSPIFYWTKEDCDRYMLANQLPSNPVKEKICISGECLCGAFTKKEEWAEIQRCFPEAANEINRLHEIAIESGHPWGWASNPIAFKKSLQRLSRSMFMCVGCEEKNFKNRAA